MKNKNNSTHLMSSVSLTEGFQHFIVKTDCLYEIISISTMVKQFYEYLEKSIHWLSEGFSLVDDEMYCAIEDCIKIPRDRINALLVRRVGDRVSYTTISSIIYSCASLSIKITNELRKWKAVNEFMTLNVELSKCLEYGKTLENVTDPFLKNYIELTLPYLISITTNSNFHEDLVSQTTGDLNCVACEIREHIDNYIDTDLVKLFSPILNYMCHVEFNNKLEIYKITKDYNWAASFMKLHKCDQSPFKGAFVAPQHLIDSENNN